MPPFRKISRCQFTLRHFITPPLHYGHRDICLLLIVCRNGDELSRYRRGRFPEAGMVDVIYCLLPRCLPLISPLLRRAECCRLCDAERLPPEVIYEAATYVTTHRGAPPPRRAHWLRFFPREMPTSHQGKMIVGIIFYQEMASHRLTIEIPSRHYQVNNATRNNRAGLGISSYVLRARRHHHGTHETPSRADVARVVKVSRRGMPPSPSPSPLLQVKSGENSTEKQVCQKEMNIDITEEARAVV